jgi:hypothetical protein
MRTGRRNRSTKRKSALVPFVHHKYHVAWPEIKPGPPWWDAELWHSSHCGLSTADDEGIDWAGLLCWDILQYYEPVPGEEGSHGSVVGWGTMLQAGRSPVRVSDEVDFFNLPNPSSCTMALGSTEPLTEMSTRNLPGGKRQPACRADTIYEPTVQRKCGSLNLSQP